MKCPICGKPVESTDPFFPFCCDRCRILDLGNWASGKYVIPGAIHPEDDMLDEDDDVDYDVVEEDL